MQQFKMINQFKLNQTYSSLKKYCLLLNKELSTMKEKNEYLSQRVKELETTLSSVVQHTITKEEMKEMIKEGVAPIVNVLIGTEK